jgi:hypothetical protein
VFYRPYLVYCSHFNDHGAPFEYLRDFALPLLTYCIAMSILYLHYHQARFYRQIARNLETVNQPMPGGCNGGR